MKEVLPHSLTEKHRATYARNVIAEPKVFQPTLLRPGRAKKNTLPSVKGQRGNKEKCSLKPTQSKPEALTRAGNGAPRFNQSAPLRVKGAKQFKPTSTLLEVGLTTRPKGGRHTKTSKRRPTVQKNCLSSRGHGVRLELPRNEHPGEGLVRRGGESRDHHHIEQYWWSPPPF